jgi:hypothetical protein
VLVVRSVPTSNPATNTSANGLPMLVKAARRDSR